MSMSEAGRIGYLRQVELGISRTQLEHKRALNVYIANPKACLFCKNQLPYEKRTQLYCTRACYGFSKLLAPENRRTRICACGTPSESGRCLDCYNETRRNDQPGPKAHAQTVRRFLLNTRNHQCEICKCKTWLNKPIALEADHINGKSDDNREENLRLICPNCHAQTETYKAKNKGKGSSRQTKRMKRYYAGQTF